MPRRKALKDKLDSKPILNPAPMTFGNRPNALNASSYVQPTSAIQPYFKIPTDQAKVVDLFYNMNR
jgi:hypothetical protein